MSKEKQVDNKEILGLIKELGQLYWQEKKGGE
jgi:hypothetical protein